MTVEPTAIPDVLLLKPRVFGDGRGRFLETWSQRRYAEAGVPSTFVQDNAAFSRRGVLRGLHYQEPNAQGKLVSVLEGEVFDVAVDIRPDSETFRRWVGYSLSGENGWQLWVPPGFAHGYAVISDAAVFAYKCTAYYDAAADRAVAWDDPAIGIEWPLTAPRLSEKDAAAPRLADIDPADLPSR